MKRILDMKLTTVSWIAVGLMWIGIVAMWGLPTMSTAGGARDGNRWVLPDSHYYAQYSVFCAYKDKAVSCMYVPRDTIRGN